MEYLYLDVDVLEIHYSLLLFLKNEPIPLPIF